MDDLTMTKNRGRETRRAAQSSRSPAQWCWKCLRVPGLGDGTYGRPWPIWGFLSHGGSPVVTMVVHPFMVIPHVCLEFPKTPNADITSNWILSQTSVRVNVCVTVDERSFPSSSCSGVQFPGFLGDFAVLRVH